MFRRLIRVLLLVLVVLSEASVQATGSRQASILPLLVIQTLTPDTEAQIIRFTARTTHVPLEQLKAGATRIPVSWALINRPEGTNLVFEQVFPDGTARNVELPRDFRILPAQGNGEVAPVLPADSNRVQLRLRLVSLSDSQTLASAEIILPILIPPSDIADLRVARGPECLDVPYRPSNGMGNVRSGRANRESPLNVSDAPLGGDIIGQLASGQIFTVVDPVPACWQIPSGSNNQIEYRLWHVRSGALDGWVNEYSRGLLGMFYNIEPLDAASASSTDGCFTALYEPDQGIRVGSQVKPTLDIHGSGARISVVNMLLMDNTVLDVLKPGNVLDVVGGPVCRRDLTFVDILPLRQWRIRSESGDFEAWVHEYEVSGRGVVFQLVPAG